MAGYLRTVPKEIVNDNYLTDTGRFDSRMMDMEYEEIIEERTKDWLARENKRLEALREELNRASRMMKQEAEKLKEEKALLEKKQQEFLTEKKDWSDRIHIEKQKIEEEQAFFDKRFKVLEIGFARLESDRKTFESQKRAFEYKQRFEQQKNIFGEDPDLAGAASQMYFFRGVTHLLALKKRYKDLIKIYHPDNMDGDKGALQQINKEYEQLKKTISYQRKA